MTTSMGRASDRTPAGSGCETVSRRKAGTPSSLPAKLLARAYIRSPYVRWAQAKGTAGCILLSSFWAPSPFRQSQQVGTAQALPLRILVAPRRKLCLQGLGGLLCSSVVHTVKSGLHVGNKPSQASGHRSMPWLQERTGSCCRRGAPLARPAQARAMGGSAARWLSTCPATSACRCASRDAARHA